MEMIDFIVNRGEEMYFAECEQLSIVTQGKTLDEIVSNVYEAVELYFEDDAEVRLSENVKIQIHYELKLSEHIYA